jgi:hypothetical protein
MPRLYKYINILGDYAEKEYTSWNKLAKFNFVVTSYLMLCGLIKNYLTKGREKTS